MKAATLSIGDELVLGQTADTNASWIAARLAEEGLLREEHRTVPDDLEAIAAAMEDLVAGRSLLVVTGGLGPTADDLTREALNRLVDGDAPLVEDAAARASLDRWFRGRGRSMPPSNLVQALRPRSARCLDNPAGTAPGLAARAGTCQVFCLPGPPREMEPMFDREVLPAARAVAGPVSMPTVAVHAFGQGESALAERLGDRMRRDADPLVGTTASRSIVSARIRSQGPREEATERVERMALEVERAWHPYAYGRGETSLAEATLGLLRERDETLATAESCTGGLLGAALTAIPGSSDSYAGGWVVYSNDMKERQLHVSPSILAAHGAVSEPVAHELAVAARSTARATWGIGITGIAGPGGGSPTKPVGTVFIGLSGPLGAAVRRFHFPGERETIRDRAVKAALQWLRCTMLGFPDTPLLWGFAEAPKEERR